MKKVIAIMPWNKEKVICPVMFVPMCSLTNRPMVLVECGHSISELAVKHLETESGIECPMCRVISPKAIRNFALDEFVADPDLGTSTFQNQPLSKIDSQTENCAQDLFLQGKDQEALSLLDRLIVSNPFNADLFLRRAHMLMELGNNLGADKNLRYYANFDTHNSTIDLPFNLLSIRSAMLENKYLDAVHRASAVEYDISQEQCFIYIKILLFGFTAANKMRLDSSGLKPKFEQAFGQWAQEKYGYFDNVCALFKLPENYSQFKPKDADFIKRFFDQVKISEPLKRSASQEDLREAKRPRLTYWYLKIGTYFQCRLRLFLESLCLFQYNPIVQARLKHEEYQPMC